MRDPYEGPWRVGLGDIRGAARAGSEPYESERIHVVCVSYFYELKHDSPSALLDSYPTIIDWADALSAAGACVTVVQRFRINHEMSRRDVLFRFVAGKPVANRPSFRRDNDINRVVAGIGADIAHINGLAFAPQAMRLKQMAPDMPVLIQDHANSPNQFGIRVGLIRQATRKADAVSFAAPELADPWRQRGCLGPNTRVISLMESSSRFRLIARGDARSQTGLAGEPLCLWVGRLNSNKDPITVLEGFSKAAYFMKDPRLAFIYGESRMLPEVVRWLKSHPKIAARVHLIGKLPHEELEAYYNSADIFVLGSHREGSGYSLLEAMACGATPVVTDIPTFRTLAGARQIGALWSAGDSDHLAVALAATSRRLNSMSRDRVRAHFDSKWSIEALGINAMAAYRSLVKGCVR